MFSFTTAVQHDPRPDWSHIKGLSQLVKSEASTLQLSTADLMKQCYLHFARFSTSELNKDIIVRSEVSRLAERLKNLRHGYEYLERVSEDVRLEELETDQVTEQMARIVHEKFHYIGQYRRDSLHIGLFHHTKNDRQIIGMVTFSKFDLHHLLPYVKDIPIEKMMIVSRIFAFDYAPKNFESYMIARTLEKLKDLNPDISLLLTYLNPNIGFTGTIYRASNWRLLGNEEIQQYVYLDGNYTTLRAIREEYGNIELQSLGLELGNRLTYSVQPLRPLQIFLYPLKKQLRGQFPQDANYSILKKPPIA